MTEKIAAVLQAAVGSRARVFFAHPADWAEVPAVSYRQVGGRTYARADGAEALGEWEYAVDIWAKSAEEAMDIWRAADRALLDEGFRRAQAVDLYEKETGYFRRAARYRALSDGENIYQ